jgi:hypothetical protein
LLCLKKLERADFGVAKGEAREGRREEVLSGWLFPIKLILKLYFKMSKIILLKCRNLLKIYTQKSLEKHKIYALNT